MFDIVKNSKRFDPIWYQQRYPDVAKSGMSEEAHFALIGSRLGRGLSERYPRLLARDPLALALGRRRAAVRASANSQQIAISYCIPSMDRLSEIKETLEISLAENAPFSGMIEFLIVAFEDDTATSDWARRHFWRELESGYLRVVQKPRLDAWHFGIAKNCFRDHISGSLYSSLDADNVVTNEETSLLLKCLSEYGQNFIFHHFSGTWGDGSSGRLTLPSDLYLTIGYDESFFPRQFDEIDVILSTLSQSRSLTLLHYDVGLSAIETNNIQKFFKDMGFHPKTRAMPIPRRVPPLNPKSADYATENENLRLMQSINEALSFLKNLPEWQSRTFWQQRISQDLRSFAKLHPHDVFVALTCAKRSPQEVLKNTPIGSQGPNMMPRLGGDLIPETLWTELLKISPDGST